MKWENYFKTPKGFNMWPADLKSIELRGGMNFTELWMVKERFDAGHLKMLKKPEPVWDSTGRYYTVYGDEAGAYTFCTHGAPGTVNMINKLTLKSASWILTPI